jgi:hypothetical protein
MAQGILARLDLQIPNSVLPLSEIFFPFLTNLDFIDFKNDLYQFVPICTNLYFFCRR